jgi:transposase
MTSKQEEQRVKILLAQQENPTFSHAKLAKLLDVAKSTVTNVLKVFGERLSTARKPGSGSNRNRDMAATTKKVAAKYKRNPNLSIRDAAGKLNVSHTTVQRAKKRAGLSTFKKVKVANRDYKQNMSAKQRSRKLYLNLLTKFDCVVMDDETYVKADFKQLPGQEFYTASGKGMLAEIFKTIKLSKFPKKNTSSGRPYAHVV